MVVVTMVGVGREAPRRRPLAPSRILPPLFLPSFRPTLSFYHHFGTGDASSGPRPHGVGRRTLSLSQTLTACGTQPMMHQKDMMRF